MAAPNARISHLNRTLHALSAELRDLPSLADEWEGLSESEQASIALDWDHLMATYLPEVEHAYRAGALTDEQRHQYHRLRRQLRDAQPLFAQLNLFRSNVLLED